MSVAHGPCGADVVDQIEDFLSPDVRFGAVDANWNFDLHGVIFEDEDEEV